MSLSSRCLGAAGFAWVVALALAQAQAGAGASGQQTAPGAGVVAYLDRLYQDIEAKHPNPTVPPSKGLMKTKPIVNDDVTRETYRPASALSRVLGYDFVKLAVIEHYGRQVDFSRSGSAKVSDSISQLIDGLPNGQPGVEEAKRIGASLWLCRHPFLSNLSSAEIVRRTDEYLARAIPAKVPTKERGLAILGAFEQACTIGTPPSKLRPIRPTMRQTMFTDSAKVSDATGLPFESVARVESVNGPLVLWNLVRSLPKDYPGRDAALAALSSLQGKW